MSLAVSPFLSNLEIRMSTSSVKRGRSLVASLLLAVVESLLPTFTVHDGPPT